MGDGVPNDGPFLDFEPTTGEFHVDLCLGSHIRLTRTQHNDARAAAVTAGGMSDVSAAYAAVKSTLDSAHSGWGAWLDHFTTGQTSTETSNRRRGVVWQFVARGEIPAPPQP